MQRLRNIYYLGIKELFSLRRDPVMVALIVWAFTLSLYTAASGISHELNNASLAIVDEDRSPLSMRIAAAFLPPEFRRPEIIPFAAVDQAMDSGKYTFVVVLPRGFEEDLLAERGASAQINIDATAVEQAGLGATYIANIIELEAARFLTQVTGNTALPIRQTVRIAFNPNLTSSWFTSVMELISRITMLAIVITGAALIREREHGTIEHLLAMPLSSMEILLGKVWANGLVILGATAFALFAVIKAVLSVPIAGSPALFLFGVAIYLFSTAAIGIFLSTFARSMPQFGLLFILVVLPMQLLSGAQAPVENQPAWLQTIMQGVASTHFVRFAQAILYRGAGIEVVWPQFLAIALIGIAFFAIAALRFRRTLAMAVD